MPIKPTHIATDKETGTKKIPVEYDEETKEYKQNFMVALIEDKWNFKPIEKEQIT